MLSLNEERSSALFSLMDDEEIKELSVINFEIAQMTVASDEEETLPDWFMVEIIRDLPRLVDTL